MNHLSSRVQISSLRHHDAGRPAGEFGGLVKIRRRDRERRRLGTSRFSKRRASPPSSALRTRISATGAWARLEGIVVTAITRYQLRRVPASGPHAGALSFSEQDGREADRGWLEIRC